MKIRLSTKALHIFLFDIIQVGLLLSLTGAALAVAIVNRIGVWMIFIAILAMSLLGISRVKENILPSLSILVIIALAFISMLDLYQWSHKNITNLLSFLEIPLIITFAKPIDSSRRIKSACFFSFLISIFYIYCYFSDRAHYFATEYGIRIIDALTLGFSNPNETGMHLVSTFSVLCAGVFFVKKKLLRVFLLTTSAIMACLIVMTLSRASILVLIILIALLLPTIRNKKIPKALQKICFLSPFISFLIVVQFSKFLSSVTLFGETIDTGRVHILISRFESMDFFEWLIGDYSYTFQNSLNAYLSVFLTVGLIALCAFLVVINFGVKTCDTNAVTNYNKIAFLGVLLFIVHASVESANLVAGSFYAASYYSIYVIAIDNAGSGWLDDLKNRTNA